MKVNLPKHEQYSRVRLTVNMPQGSKTMVLGDPHKVAELKLPEGVGENEVEVVAQYMDGGSRLVAEPFVLRSPTPPRFKTPPTPDAEPELEARDEEAPAKDREEDVLGMVERTPEPVQGVVEDAPEPAPEQEEVKKPRRKRRSN